MTILKEAEKLKEVQTVAFDKLRTVGSLSGWQRKLYNFITVRLASGVLEVLVTKINMALPQIVPEGVDPEEVKSTIKKSLIDFIDSTF